MRTSPYVLVRSQKCPRKKINTSFLINWSSWEVFFIKSCWHDEKFTIMVTSRNLVYYLIKYNWKSVTHLQQFLRRYSGSKRIFRPMSACFFQLCSRRRNQTMFSWPWRSNKPNGQRILLVFCVWHWLSQPKGNPIISIKIRRVQFWIHTGQSEILVRSSCFCFN